MKAGSWAEMQFLRRERWRLETMKVEPKMAGDGGKVGGLGEVENGAAKKWSDLAE